MDDYYNLGEYGYPVTTTSPEAQRWFDRGLNWTYGFNHEEAVRCFQRALEYDPDCAMAQWGIAFAGGPHYNLRWDQYTDPARARMLATCYSAAQRALSLAGRATPLERAVIEAVQARYPQSVPIEDCRVWNYDFADAMRSVYQSYPDDLFVAALFAESLLNRTPWQLWDLESGMPAEGAATEEAMAVLERALTDPAGQRHPGVLHMYIHLMEMSPFPEKALRAADWLRTLEPDNGHLCHMPTHIDVLCGQYHNVVAGNNTAIAADNKFLERQGPQNVYTYYGLHNHHVKLYGAMFLGQSKAALEAADAISSRIPRQLLELREPTVMADRLEGYLSVKLHALIRFGMWQEIIDTPLPDDPALYCVTTAMLHYAKGVAYAATGRVPEAEEQQRLFRDAVKRVPETRMHGQNRSLELLAIAEEMLAGELEYRKGNYEEAFAHLRESIRRYDALKYGEPWAWMQPVRHAYGALLSEQGRYEEALAVYEADLGLNGSLSRSHQHPDNVWSLHGYHECLMQLGRHELCGIISQRLALAAARADVPIESSCFCRLSHAPSEQVEHAYHEPHLHHQHHHHHAHAAAGEGEGEGE